MSEINYDKNTKMKNGFPQIKKLGAVTPNHEVTPFVWDGKLMRMELVDPSNGLDDSIPRYACIRDCASGKILSRLAEDCYFHSAYVEDGVAYVLGVDMNDRSSIRIYESNDLVNWMNRVLLTNPGWVYYNTGLTKGPDGYVLCIEASHPKEYVGVPFTIFFATSPDLKEWSFMDYDLGFSKERYNGGPWFRYSEGWYYLISVTLLPCRRYSNYIFRTKDFKDWEVGLYNPLLMPSNEDKMISPNAADITEEYYEEMKTAFVSNNSDVDMCDWQGKTYINYLVSNQMGGTSWMAEAEYDGTVAEFLAANFE